MVAAFPCGYDTAAARWVSGSASEWLDKPRAIIGSRHVENRVPNDGRMQDAKVAMMAFRACPICKTATPESSAIGELERTFSKPTSSQSYTLTYCACRELIFLTPEPTAADLRLMYAESEQFFGFYRDPEYVKSANQWHENTLYAVLTAIHGSGLSFADLKMLEIGSGLAWMCRAAKALSSEFSTVAQDVTAEVKDECPWVDRYLVAEIEDAVFDGLGPFDVVSMTHVIEHLPDPVAVLRRIAGLLKPSGVLFVTAPHRPSGWREDSGIEAWRTYQHNHVPVHLQYFSEASFERAVRLAGLAVQRWSSSEEAEAFEAWVRHPSAIPDAP